MSTIQGLSIEAQDKARRLALDEVYRRQQERLQLGREVLGMIRSGHDVRRAQADLQADLDGLHARLAETEAAVEAIREARTSSPPATAQGGIGDRLAETMRAAMQTATQLEADLRRASRHLDGLQPAAVDTDRSTLFKKLEHSAQLGTELSFLLRDPRLLASTVLTLHAMHSNGYALRETVSKDGLIGYFVSTDQTHQVAVRHRLPVDAPNVSRQILDEAAFQLEVETFEQEGDACLDVLEDFVLGLEATRMAEVTWAEPRHYPKRDGVSGIPVPVPVATSPASEPREAPQGPELA